MASSKKRKSDIKGETTQEKMKKQKLAFVKSECPLIQIFTMLIDLLDAMKEPSRKSASKSNGDYLFSSATYMSHDQVQRMTRTRT